MWRPCPQPRRAPTTIVVRQKEAPVGRLTEDAKRVLAQTKVIPVATASKDGLPNVVPMTFVKTLDDSTVLIADNYMDKGASEPRREPPRLDLCLEP